MRSNKARRAPRGNFASTRSRGRRGRGALVSFLLLGGVGFAVFGASGIERYAPALVDFSRKLVGHSEQGAEPVALVARMRPMPICGAGKRVTCVVDGDTFWINGEKVRIQSIDAPEVRVACPRERELAQQATQRLSEILASQDLRLDRSGTDRYGRTLALVKTGAGEAGEILVREGLAQRWAGRKAQWCS